MSKSSTRPFVAVIIPTYGREVELVDTINSLLATTYPKERRQIIVVDQTKEHSQEVVTYLEGKHKSGAISWFHPPEIAFASLTKARNFGIDQAGAAEILLFVDDDVLVEPDFIDQHVAAYVDTAVGATAGRITVPGHSYPTREPEIVGAVTWWGGFINNYYGQKKQQSNGFVGCNFSLRASILPKTGQFDEEFRGNALREDTDMAVRVREAGYEIRYLPDAAVVHRMTASGGTRSSASRLDWYEALFHNHFLFYGKHAAAWRMPFFILHLWRPLLACSFYYGKGSKKALIIPWRGMISGWKAAQRSRQQKLAWVDHPVVKVV